MKFEKAYELLRDGYKIKLPSWKGFWAWDSVNETILIHTQVGVSYDLRLTENVDDVMRDIMCETWEIATEDNCELLGGYIKFGFDEAIRQLKGGKAVKRLGWNGKDQYITLDELRYWEKKKEHGSDESTVFVFHGTSGKQLGWLASQGDMLAEDWTFA